MQKIRWYLHPLFIFIFSLAALGSSLVIYIKSYLEVNNAFNKFVLKHHLESTQLLQSQSWVIILTLSILVSLILIGLFIIYTYYSRVIRLYRLQQNFIAGFTHELKTPIASLRLFIDSFLKFELPRDEQLKYLNFMLKDTQRLDDNVGHILNLGKIEEKNFKANFQEIDLNKFMADYISKNNYLHKEISIEINLKEQVNLHLDISLFEILLNNLISNAIAHNKDEEGIKKLEISFEKESKFLKMSFKDNGMGLDHMHKLKIFKKFYQIGKTTKGSGIGLYMCHQIARIHNGQIKVESKGLGFGTTFIVKFSLSLNNAR